MLAFSTVALDRRVSPAWARMVYSGGPDGARTLLSAIATSVITVAGVSFSITIVALQLASGQFGPRVLYNFMRDTGNQAVLGALVATYLYELVVLQAVRSPEEGAFVPRIAVALGFGLGIVSVGVLIYFIHHVAEEIHANNLISRIYGELEQSIRRLLRPGDGGEGSASGEPPPPVPGSALTSIDNACSGYVQAIDFEGLVRLAAAADVVLQVAPRPGAFVAHGGVLACVHGRELPGEDLAGPVRGAFLFAARRSPEQDVEFAIDQLTEVAVRALSPGINDPFTAIVCIDWLGAALCRVLEQNFPPRWHRDAEGTPRVLAENPTFRSFVDAAFNQIRQAGRHHAAVSIRLLESITTVAGRARTAEERDALRRQAKMIERSSRDGLPEPEDRRDVRERFEAAMRALDGERTG